MNKDTDRWEVSYPDGLIKVIDMFRVKYFQYPVFDSVIDKYIKTFSKTKGKRICSLGSGTGHHEVELAQLGYEVIGLERNKESVEISRHYIASCGVNVTVYECDFLKKAELDNVMAKVGAVDVCLLLLIPISIKDYSLAAQNMSKWICPGGLFIADNFDYSESYYSKESNYESNIEVAQSLDDKENYAVRFNYYEYGKRIIKWDAVYLYQKNGNVCMKHDQDILDVIPEHESDSCLDLKEEEFEILPNHKIVECEEGLAPPYLYEYIIGRRKKWK